MATMLNVTIDCSKITKSKLEKGKYLRVTVALSDEPSKYGTNVSGWEEQSKEHREAGHGKNYLGNGRVFWYNNVEPVVLNKDGEVVADVELTADTESDRKENAKLVSTEHQPFEEESEDLPF